MRVIAGKHRGVVLNEFKGKDIRPTSDRAKEAIFNMLQTEISGAKCLDLCCGTGSLGIEALSRGAQSVTFVDLSKESVEITKRNLQKVKENAKVIQSDAIKFLDSTNEKFDIVFLDPPYANDVSVKAVEKIMERNLLTNDGFIVFERDCPFSGAMGASVFKERKYGKAIVSFIRKQKTALFAGTFDPFTLGHEEVVKQALKSYDLIHVVIMNNPDKNCLFSLDDRLGIIEAVYKGEGRVKCACWQGLLVDYMKDNSILYNVRGIRNESDLKYEREMEEYNKKLFPEMVYDYVYTDSPISSSSVRDRLKSGREVGDLLSRKALEYLKRK